MAVKKTVIPINKMIFFPLIVLEWRISSKMTKVGSDWHCTDCEYSSYKKFNIKTHIEVQGVKLLYSLYNGDKGSNLRRSVIKKFYFHTLFKAKHLTFTEIACSVCGAICSNRKGLRYHMSIYHKSSQYNPD